MVTLEVCVDSIAGAKAALRGGADRIELCSALSEGGLTPSYGLMKSAASLPIPCVAMIRPRVGNFQFTSSDVNVMLADIDAVKEAGLAGVVLGAQAQHGGLDVDLLNQLVNCAEGMPCSLHRVVDVVDDPIAAIDDAINLGLTRVLTSGGCANAIDGLDQIVRMHNHAQGRISVMPGSGLHSGNIEHVLAAGVRDVHASCSALIVQQHCLPVSEMDGDELTWSVTSEQLVADMRQAIVDFERGLD